MKNIIALIVSYLPELIKVGQSYPVIMDFLQKVRATLKQSKEWTEEEEAAFDKYEQLLVSGSHWKSKETQPPIP